MSIAETVRAITQTKKELAEIKKQFESASAAKQREIEGLQQRLALAKAGLDISRIERAMTIIRVRGNVVTGSGFPAVERQAVVNDAINDLAAGGVRLRREYFGVKNYAHFGDQRSDHSYGMGPSHGSIVFSVELRERARDLGPDEIDDAIYALLNIEELLRARNAAEAA